MTDVVQPPPHGTELEMLLAFNNQQREAMLWKLEGLTDLQLRAKHPTTGFSLLGLLKHVIRAEQSWFQRRLMNDPVDADPNDETAWIPTEAESFAVLADLYRTTWKRSNEIARTLPLEQLTVHHSATYGPMSLQWVLLHMIEETARHLGHADVMRQSIDGATGVNPEYEQRKRTAVES